MSQSISLCHEFFCSEDRLVFNELHTITEDIIGQFNLSVPGLTINILIKLIKINVKCSHHADIMV